jgi:hypothetical protein
MATDIYEQFGAKVDFAEGPPGLFLVISANGDPGRLVASYDGQIALRLNNGGKVLARLTLPKALALQREPGIRLVGGVNLDINRYRKMLQFLGAANGPVGQ